MSMPGKENAPRKRLAENHETGVTALYGHPRVTKGGLLGPKHQHRRKRTPNLRGLIIAGV